MSATNDMGQAEFDLQRVMDLFDTALISKDERVVNALRNLLMIVALTNPEDADAKGDIGPLRAMERDLDAVHSRIRGLEDQVRHITDALSRNETATRSYNSYNWQHAVDPYADKWRQNMSDITMRDYLTKINGGPI
jgi:hypothetical protein